MLSRQRTGLLPVAFGPMHPHDPQKLGSAPTLVASREQISFTNVRHSGTGVTGLEPRQSFNTRTVQSRLTPHVSRLFDCLPREWHSRWRSSHRVRALRPFPKHGSGLVHGDPRAEHIRTSCFVMVTALRGVLSPCC